MRQILLALILAPFSLCAAEIYKSVDEHGNVTYSHERPAGGNVEVIRTEPEPSTDQVKTSKEQEEMLEKTLKAMESEDQKLEADEQPANPGNPDVAVEGGGAAVAAPEARRRGLATGADTASGANTARGAPTAGDLEHMRRHQRHGRRR